LCHYGRWWACLGSMLASDSPMVRVWKPKSIGKATLTTPWNLRLLMEVSGGVGTIVGFVHDWANPENTRRSWDMVARYVIPEINGYTAKLRESQKFVIENRAVFERAGQAVMAKIMENDKAAAALPLTGPGRVAIPTINAPDLQKEAAKRKA
jgi:limonene 1,2-monooxygenase